jgi:ferritin-like metal-binding protein YciE
MKIKTLQELLLEELKDLYDAEHRILKALPKMVKAASNEDLRQGFELHRTQTENQVTRLEKAFEHLNASAKKKTCEAIKGILEEGEDLMDTKMEPEVLDAALIGAAQKVEHYEIASYGTVRSWAQHLGLSEVVSLLEQTLEEEKQTDQKLTQLAESMINQEANV